MTYHAAPTEPNPLTDPTLAAFGRLLACVYASSGVESRPGTTTIRPIGDGASFEVLADGLAVGVITREAILELAERIRMERN